MEANPRSPRELFEGKEHFEIPAFQRPYVWNEEDQWAPLWDDIVRVAEAYTSSKESGFDPLSIPKHFLGAVVFETRPPIAGDVTRHEVIDGQQRMTTLQILLDAVQEVVEELGAQHEAAEAVEFEKHADALRDLVLNRSKTFAGKRERFKLWPSQADREAFERAMDPEGELEGDHRITDAHRFFRQEATRWLRGKPDEDGSVPPGTEELRVEALSSTLLDQLTLIAIDLSGHDDSQLIFETLNDRGTPLLKADLIKNWIFRKGVAVGADMEKWSTSYWGDFDTEWWRHEIKQGRQARSRVDIFLQYWLTMRRQDEVKSEQAFRIFAEYAEPQVTSLTQADAILAELRSDADTYRELAYLDRSTVEGRFYSRVVETMELAVVMPVFLWLLSKNHSVPPQQIRIGLDAMESWIIRRALLRLTTKDINRFMVAVLKAIVGGGAEVAGDTIRSFLAEQTAETRIWPTDAAMLTQLPNAKLYGLVQQGRIRVVLAAVEQHLRGQSAKHEPLQLPAGLEVEHVMPQGWRTHWDTEPTLTTEQAAARDLHVNTIGNLTLVTKALNVALSNRPWTDSQAAGLKDGGEPGKGKRTLLDGFSLLVLNKEIVQNHPATWEEDDIAARSKELAEAICAIWPRPANPEAADARH